VVADEGFPRRVVDEERVGCAVPRAMDDAERSASGDDLVALGELDVGLVVGAAADDVLPERLAVRDQLLGDAVRREQLLREGALGGRQLVVANAPRRGRRECCDPRAGALSDRRRQAGMVEVVVREEQELDVLDREPAPPERLLEGAQRLVAPRPCVDERERVAREQPDVDAAEERNR